MFRCLALAVVAMFAMPTASADDPAPTEEQLAAAKLAFNESNTLFKAGKLVEAIVKLEESYRLSRNAMLLYNIGRIYDKIGEKDKVLFYLRKFLRDAPADAPLRGEATTRVAELELDIVVVAAVEPESPPPLPPASKYSAADFKHLVIDTVRASETVYVTATVPEDSGFTVTLFYRGTGEGTYVAERMYLQGKELVARIPETKVVGKWLQYYLEVRDGENNVVTRSARSTSPNLVNIEMALPVTTASLPEDPLRVDNPPPPPQPPREPLRPGKWIASGAAVALIAGTVAFYVRGQQQHDLLVADSNGCGVPPCREFNSFYSQGIESRGILYERLYMVSIGLSVGTIALASYLWHRDLTATKKPADAQIAVTPAFGNGSIGAALEARF